MMADEGWTHWLQRPPHPDALVEVCRPGTAFRQRVMYRRDMCQLCQANGLYWRLTGIAKEAGYGNA